MPLPSKFVAQRFTVVKGCFVSFAKSFGSFIIGSNPLTLNIVITLSQRSLLWIVIGSKCVG